MCGRTSLFVPQSVLEERFDATTVHPLTPRYNIAPRDDLACITNESPAEIDTLEWGLVPHWVDDPAEFSRPINARVETVTEKPAFREAIRKRRCLVLADGFYEWKGTRGSKEPFRITRTDGDPFAMAGVWEQWGSNGQTLRTVTILTTDSNDVIAPIHDRMPVLLVETDERQWIEGQDISPTDFTGSYPTGELRAYPVSRAVNDPANDTPEVVEERGDVQSGLGDFG